MVYRSVRGTTQLIGLGVDAGLVPLTALMPEGESSASTRRARVDRERGLRRSPRAHRESARHRDAVPARRPAHRRRPRRPGRFPDATGRVLLIVHGLCLNESHWSRDGSRPVEELAATLGCTPVFLRYNSGRAIADNGAELSAMLETLLGNWPQPRHGTRHRRAQHGRARREERRTPRATRRATTWPGRLRRLVFLGTPLHGSPLERGGHRLDYLMELSPYVAPFTRLGKSRSAGIMDLRHGSITRDEQEFIPLPEDVACYAPRPRRARRATS